MTGIRPADAAGSSARTAGEGLPRDAGDVEPDAGERAGPGAPVPDYGAEAAREIGRRLRTARMVRALDVATAARAQLIPAADLEALEDGDFARVAGEARLPILLRAYGNYLGLDGEALARPRAASLDRIAVEAGRERRRRARRAARRATVAAAAVLLLAVAVAAAYGARELGGAGPAGPSPRPLASGTPPSDPPPPATVETGGDPAPAPAQVEGVPNARPAPVGGGRAGTSAAPTTDGGPGTAPAPEPVAPDAAPPALATAPIPEPPPPDPRRS